MNSKEKYHVDHLADGTETVTLSGYGAVPPNAAKSTYSNVTVTSISAGSGSGLVYSAGTGTTIPTWSSPNGTSGTIHAKDLVLDGVSLKEILEERLNMLVPNPELEKEWDQLKQLGDAYRKLEADCKEKSSVWKALKKL